MDAHQTAQDFFETYASALLARDQHAVADLYAVPALIVFPGQSLAVSDRSQTEDFFASAFGQYDGVADASTTIDVPVQAEHSIWADVTWSYDGTPRERFVYQLVRTEDSWRIAVLTPLEV